MRKLILLFFLLTAFNAKAQYPRVQFINNCPDPAMSEVDVYVNGMMLIPQLPFRHATAYMDVPPGANGLDVGFAQAGSTGPGDILVTMNHPVTPTDTLVFVLNGMKTSTGFTPPQALTITKIISREAAHNAANAEAVFVNGCSDLDVMDTRKELTTLVNDLNFGNYSSYFPVDAGADIGLRITNSLGNHTVNTYLLPVGTMGWAGQSMVILSSGFIDPAINNNGPAMGLFVALPAGGFMEKLAEYPADAFARLQIIHNSADAAIQQVDVYIDNVKVADDMPFRSATEFMDVFGKVQTDISFAPANSLTVADRFFNQQVSFDSAGTYVLVANGQKNSAGFTPYVPFGLHSSNTAKEVLAAGSKAQYMFNQGCTDAPPIDVQLHGGGLAADDMIFGAYSSYYTLTDNSVQFNLSDMGGTAIFKSYSAFIPALEGKPSVIVTSGYLNPAGNNNGPAFGLFASKQEGGSLLPLTEVPVPISVRNLNSDALFSLWPNPATDKLNIEVNQATVFNLEIYDMVGRIVLKQDVIKNQAIDISSLNKGVYLVRLQNNGHSVTAQFIKQ